MGGEIQERVSAKKYPLGEEKKLLYTVMSSKPDNITLGKKKLLNTGCSPKNFISAQQRRQLKCHKSLNKERQHHPVSIQNQDIFVH